MARGNLEPDTEYSGDGSSALEVRTAERFAREDFARREYLRKELDYFGVCQRCGCRLQFDAERRTSPSGLCGECKRHQNRSVAKATALRQARLTPGEQLRRLPVSRGGKVTGSR